MLPKSGSIWPTHTRHLQAMRPHTRREPGLHVPWRRQPAAAPLRPQACPPPPGRRVSRGERSPTHPPLHQLPRRRRPGGQRAHPGRGRSGLGSHRVAVPVLGPPAAGVKHPPPQLPAPGTATPVLTPAPAFPALLAPPTEPASEMRRKRTRDPAPDFRTQREGGTTAAGVSSRKSEGGA